MVGRSLAATYSLIQKIDKNIDFIALKALQAENGKNKYMHKKIPYQSISHIERFYIGNWNRTM